MLDKAEQPPGIPHGAKALPAVTVDSCNLELKDDEGFIGDRASKGALMEIVDDWRERLDKAGDDPLGDAPTRKIGRSGLEKILKEGEPEAAGLVLGAVEEYARAFAGVIRRFLRARGWKDTERIAIGGGLRGSRLGELAIGRAEALLKADGVEADLKPIDHHPDEAGLIGAAYLAPSWIFAGHDAILAADIGGTNMRAGLVRFEIGKKGRFEKLRVSKSELWRHLDDKPSREEAVERLAAMLRELAAAAGKKGAKLAPFVGIGCPGVIEPDGSISRGAQNLPGNWVASTFHLPSLLKDAIPEIGGHETMVVLHNDAVVQGLSEVPAMRDVTRWGVLTIGTGLGNARFTNREPPG